MQLHPSSFTTSQWIPFPLEQVFAFFANPQNLPRLMPDAMHTRLERAHINPPPDSIAANHLPLHERSNAAGIGSEMEISFRPMSWLPFRVRWTARIVEFAWNSHFCDEQVRGPFAAFRHCHRVEPQMRDGINGTLVVDAIEFRLPFGILGRMAEFFVRRNLASSFAYRQRQLPRCLEAA